MNLDTRKLLTAARYGRLYDTSSGATMVAALTASGLTARRAQLKLVEQALADGLLVRDGNGIYQLTESGLAAVAR